ncbi:MAG TPA: hydantoinase B/oxoprolinase family protein [Geminicoccaceae bacterium]|nr:hydantoinase B/oxoprolinase family protein [Geminicoccaceae bacterium]
MDQLVLEVLWNRLISVVNEQAAALMRTSFTSIVREAGDLSAGVFDRRGRMIAQAVTGTPGHINPMATCMHHFLAKYPVDTLRPGDVLITNDPWKTASQLNDITIVTPIFKDDRVVALFGNCCHALDIGGRGLAADSREVFEEGLFIPVLKLYDAGAPVEPVFAFLSANVRTPEEVLGDVHSQVVGNEVGGRQLLSFLDEFGLDDIEDLSDVIVERTERAMRERIAALPDGDYSYRFEIDGFDAPVRIEVTVRVQGDELIVDYAGSSPPVSQGINVALNYTAGYTTYGVKCAISPDVPNNEGSFRPVTVTAPEGCILNAPYPCAIGGRHLVGHFLPTAVFGALADALPERVIAPGADALWDTQIFGEDPKTGKRFTYVWFSAGGAGALATKDGLSATAFPSGIAGVPAEVIETLSPVVLKRRELRCDSGGPGEFRGGLGQTLELAVQGERPFVFSGLYERIDHPAPGLRGGRPGGAGALGTNRPDLAPRPKARVPLPAGTEITLELPGGGGYGPSWRRDPARVLADVRDGYVSLEQAQSAYGVAIDPDHMIVLEDETAALRADLQRK